MGLGFPGWVTSVEVRGVSRSNMITSIYLVLSIHRLKRERRDRESKPESGNPKNSVVDCLGMAFGDSGRSVRGSS